MTTDTAVRVDPLALQAALKQRDSALVRSCVLGQRGSLIDESLQRAAHEDGDVGEAVIAFLDARSALNAALRRHASEAEAKVQELAWPYLTQLFGAPMPGKVTLRSDWGLPITENVVGLEHLQVTGTGEVSGVVKTSDDDGRSGDTRAFFTRGSGVYFSNHVSL